MDQDAFKVSHLAKALKGHMVRRSMHTAQVWQAALQKVDYPSINFELNDNDTQIYSRAMEGGIICNTK